MKNEEAIKLLEEIKKAAGKWPKDVFYFIKADQALALLKLKCATCGGSKTIDLACYGGSTKHVIPCPDCQEPPCATCGGSRMVKCKCCGTYVCRNDGKPNPCPACPPGLPKVVAAELKGAKDG